MIRIEEIDTTSRAQVRRFTRFPFQIYASCAQWVPPILMDHEAQLRRDKHPFYEHSQADFFIAVQDGQDVGRIAALENRLYNQYHGVRQAQFYFFDSIEDQSVANALFERVFEWAHKRQLDTLVGPKGLGALDGYGMLTQGFEHRPMMTMMNYNLAYYPALIEALGFEKEVDFISCYLEAKNFNLPERIHRIAKRTLQRGNLSIQRFRTKGEMMKWADRIGSAYNRAFVNNWEYYPVSEREIKFVIDSIMTIADPRLIKIITHRDEMAGFLFAFPDVSAAIQRSKGRLWPFGLFDMLIEMRRTSWVALNGGGILPEYQGIGGNALLYSEMEKTLHEFQFKYADLTQVADTAVNMRNDLASLGGVPYKNHRVYRKCL